MIRQLPNLITLGRLCVVPVVLFFIWNREYAWALALCAVAGISDGLDGFLARRLDARTRLGAYLDPVADKLLLSGIYLTLGLSGVIPWWLVATVFGRDVLMLVFLGLALVVTKVRDFPPTIWGKLSTAVQIVTALVVLFNRSAVGRNGLDSIETGLIWLTVAATWWSAFHYAGVGSRMVGRRP